MGRQPIGTVLVDGRWEATPEGIALAAQKVLQQRQMQRERYKKQRDLIRQQHPELFKPRRERQTKLLTDKDDVCSRRAESALSTNKSSDPTCTSADTIRTLLQWLLP